MILLDLKDPSFYVYLSDKLNKVWVCCVMLNQSDSDNPMPIALPWCSLLILEMLY